MFGKTGWGLWIEGYDWSLDAVAYLLVDRDYAPLNLVRELLILSLSTAGR